MPLIKHFRILKKGADSLKRETERVAGKLSRAIRGGLTILMYHRVSRLATDPQMLGVSPENFEAHLAFLSKNRRLLSVSKFEAMLDKNEPFPPRSVLITFDDGYLDNLLEALPILEREGADAIFFISTSHINTRREFWWDDLERIFLENPTPLPPELRVPIGGVPERVPTGSRFDRERAYRKLHRILKTLPAREREALLAALYKWANMSPDGRKYHRAMNAEEIRRLSESPRASIGAHTRNHVALSALSPEAQLEEIASSKKTLEEITGKPVLYFSYPFGGKADYTAESVAISKRLGFKAAFAGFPGLARGSEKRYELPRLIVRNWSAEELANYL